VDVVTLRLCLHVLWDSMRRRVQVDLVVVSEVALVAEASVEAVSAVTVVIAVIDLDLVAESVTRVAATDLADSHLRMPPLAPVAAVDVVDLGVAMGVEAGSTVVPPAATESLSGPVIVTLTVTVVTATVTATETVTACRTATETATGTVTVSVTGMAAERIMDESDTVRMTNAKIRVPEDDMTKYIISLFSFGSFYLSLRSDMLVGIPDFLSCVPLLARFKG